MVPAALDLTHGASMAGMMFIHLQMELSHVQRMQPWAYDLSCALPTTSIVRVKVAGFPCKSSQRVTAVCWIETIRVTHPAAFPRAPLRLLTL